MLANPINKDEKAQDLQVLRNLFTKSVVCKTALTKGTVVTADMLSFKKPGTGFAAERLGELLGKKLAIDVEANHFLKPEDLV
jgi:N-acetylneuraminate synthase